MPSIEINIDARKVVFRDFGEIVHDTTNLPPTQNSKAKELKGKGFYFICRLIANRTGAFVTIENIACLKLWDAMQRNSIGKQVARIIDNLNHAQIDFIEWANKTNGWRVNSKYIEIIDENLITRAQAAIEKSSKDSTEIFSHIDESEIANWYIANTNALLAMTHGKPDIALDQLNKSRKMTNELSLAQLSSVLAIRIGQRLKTPFAPIPLDILPDTSLFELAIEARMLAAQAARSNSKEWPDFYKQLLRVYSLLSETGDWNSLAWILNGLGILARRLKRTEEALSYIKRAAPLAILSGDLILIQVIAFNFGNILSELELNKDDFQPHESFFGLLELNITIRETSGLAKDFAQSEFLLAYLYFKSGDFENALNFLQLGKNIIETSGSIPDTALYHRVRGLINIERAKSNKTPLEEGLADLKKAIELYQIVNHASDLEQVNAELNKYTNLN